MTVVRLEVDYVLLSNKLDHRTQISFEQATELTISVEWKHSISANANLKANYNAPKVLQGLER